MKFASLGEIATIERRSVRPEDICDGTIYVGLENIVSGGDLTSVGTVANGDLASSKFVFSQDHILYGKLRPYLAKIAVPDFDGVCSTDILPIRVGQDMDKMFVAHYLRQSHVVEQANGLAAGANLPRVSPTSLATIQIPMLSLLEQRRIAAILDKADELRAKRREAIAHLDALTQSIFHSVFGDPISNNLNWPLEPFGQVTTSRLGKMLDKKAQTGTHRFPYLRNANVQWFQINTDDLLEMDFSPADQIEFALRRGDVLVCEGGEPGRAAVWEEQSPGCYFQKALHRVRPKLDVVHPQYIVHLLWALANGGGLKDHVTVATIAHLTGEKLKRMHIPVPPVELQQTFATRVSAVERLKETHRKHLVELDALFSSLQSRAFKGEL
ncbi:restriction endonuclease [Paenarthrobacter sp. CM16]|uniref:restriction endonuclease subunit S n=1 Tax=Paenarthrobacter sp. CM16 TaxID=2738447 RepID=UPI0015580A21|nr:restriction endonuclease subunit S [Paenarthrobacter sp. CM16]NQD86823.1 restriction endonuclease [Paenarthrobacter sp. CM16]